MIWSCSWIVVSIKNGYFFIGTTPIYTIDFPESEKLHTHTQQNSNSNYMCVCVCLLHELHLHASHFHFQSNWIQYQVWINCDNHNEHEGNKKSYAGVRKRKRKGDANICGGQTKQQAKKKRSYTGLYSNQIANVIHKNNNKFHRQSYVLYSHKVCVLIHGTHAVWCLFFRGYTHCFRLLSFDKTLLRVHLFKLQVYNCDQMSWPVIQTINLFSCASETRWNK